MGFSCVEDAELTRAYKHTVTGRQWRGIESFAGEFDFNQLAPRL
jgi:hypothetical protein